MLFYEREQRTQEILNRSKIDLILLWCMSKAEILKEIEETRLLTSMQGLNYGSDERYTNLLKFNLKFLQKHLHNKF